MQFITLSAEAKPSEVTDGAYLFEADTGKVFERVAGVWVEDYSGEYPLAPHEHPLSEITGLVAALLAKQDLLVSAVNIKTINGSTVLGLGNLVVTGSGASISTTEIDFGTTPVAEASFLITDATVTALSRIIGGVAYVAPTGKDLDELEMDGLDLKFAPGVGQFTVYARGLDGYLADKFVLYYQVGA